MKSIKYIALFLGITAVGLTSCSDSFLDKNPDERTEIDSEEKIIKLLITSYPYSNPSWVGELSSDNLIDNQSPHLPTSPNDKQILSHYNYASYARWDDQLFRFEPATQATYGESDSPGQLWASYYRTIACANYAIEAINKLVPNSLERGPSMRAAEGEALLLRAYSHFMLVNFFASPFKDAETSKNDKGIPYVTHTNNVVMSNYPRGSVADNYNSIQKDLELGLEKISDINYKVAPKYHFNVNAAHAFAARFYLFTHQYEKVIAHADAVLGADTTVRLQRMMMDYSVFEKTANLSDYATAWQNPELNNNLLLIPTYSALPRRIFGSRYSCAGPAARATLMVHPSPLWSGYIAPSIPIISGMLFSSGSSDYGFFGAKIQEKFQYVNKIAGTGYVHVIYRAFTSNSLLLERAEAKIMLGRYDDAAADLMAYWNYSLKNFSQKDKDAHLTTGNTKFLTKDVLLSYWSDESHENCFKDWSFAQARVGLNIPAAAVPYMNCLNDFRRYENAFEGMRFIDIRRWGLPLKHIVGLSSDTITADNAKRIIEIPWEVLSAGTESARTGITGGKPAQLDFSSSNSKVNSSSMNLERLRNK